jgi:hypothetical protein
MNRLTTSVLAGLVIAASSAFAAEVTPERLINADREPQNWLMNHRTYDAQRYSPLDKINKANVKDLKLAYAVAIGGTSANENLEATPLAEDGFLNNGADSGDCGQVFRRTILILLIFWFLCGGPFNSEVQRIGLLSYARIFLI